MAIGGLPNTAGRVGRLHMVSGFGKQLGTAIRKLLSDNTAEHAARGTPNASWVNTTCDAIGSDGLDCGPPRSAVAAGRTLIQEFTNLSKFDV